MAFTEKISLVVDVVTGGTTSGISKLKAELDSTDGAFNKMKVAGTGAFDLIKQNAGALALGAGTALAAFGAKAVSAFQETALGAGELRDSLGVTAEEASRLQEVAGDLGIGVGTLESAMGKMNKAASATPAAFAAIGAEIAKNKDGTTDVTQTFLNTIDALNRIPDATTRAEAAAKVFGRGWMEVSELVEMGADGMQKALDSVETGKIMSDADIERARKFRDTLDELSGIAQEAAVAIGERIVPVLQTAADAFMAVKGAVEDLMDALPQEAQDAGFDPFSSWPDIVEDFQRNAKVILEASGIVEQELTGSLDPALRASADASSALANALMLDPQLRAAADAARAASESLIPFAGALGEVAELTDTAAENLIPFAGALDNVVAEGLIPFAAGMREVADAAAEAEAAIQSQADAVIASLDSSIALSNAQRDFADSTVKVQETIDDEDASMQDLAQSLDDAKSAALDSANALIQLAEDTATAEGRTLSHKDKVDILRNSLQAQADSVQGPVHDALMEMITTLDAIPETAGPVVSAPGAVQAAEDLAEANRMAGILSDSETVETSAPGAVQATGELESADAAARRLSNEETVNTTAPGAVQTTHELESADTAARRLSNEETVQTSAPGATTATGQLQDVDSAARSIPGSRNVTVSADDNATGILGRIKDAIDAIRGKTVTIGVNYVPIGGSLLAGGSKSSQPGDIAGEAGPEMLRFKSGRQAIVNEPTILPGGVEVTPFGRGGFGHHVGVGGGVFDERNPKMDRGGDIYYINVVAPLGQHPAEFGRRISEAIRDYEKINGPAWRS